MYVSQLRESGRNVRVEKLELAKEIAKRIQGMDRRDRHQVRSAFGVHEISLLNGKIRHSAARSDKGGPNDAAENTGVNDRLRLLDAGEEALLQTDCGSDALLLGERSELFCFLEALAEGPFDEDRFLGMESWEGDLFV